MNKDFIASIILALTLFLIFVLIIPEYDAIKNARAGLDQWRVLLKERNDQLQRVAALGQQYKQQESSTKKISVFLPPHKQNDYIVSSIQIATSQSGIQLNALTIAPGSENTPQYKTTLVQINASGTYTAILTFLSELERNLRLYDILEFSFNKQGDITSGNVLDITLKIRTYNTK